MKDGDVREINGEWFMYFEDFGQCENCEAEWPDVKWVNIQKAIDNLKESGRI